MIHRTGLTQESTEALLLAADVLKLIIDAAREQLHANMHAKIKGNSAHNCSLWEIKIIFSTVGVIANTIIIWVVLIVKMVWNIYKI